MDLQLKNATILVTGSSAGIGQATAPAYGAEGARIAVTSINIVKELKGQQIKFGKLEDKRWSHSMTWLILIRSAQVSSKSGRSGER